MILGLFQRQSAPPLQSFIDCRSIWIATLSFFSVCFLTLPFEITAYLNNFLSPWLFVGSQIFKTIFYSVGAAIAIYNFVVSPPISTDIWKIFRYVALAFDLALL